MNQVRSSAVAGTFYPGDATQLSHDVEQMLEDTATDDHCPKAIIAPHAGYVYSGPIAARLYARVKNAADTITRVVLLGPSHRVGFQGIAASSADMFRTPLGDIPLDKEAIKQIIGLPNTVYLDQAHEQEHSLEVHLPFLQSTLQNFHLVPLVVGDAQPEDVARVLDVLWGGKETLIVISSDLSHFKPYNDAQIMDRATSQQIEALRDDIKGDQACGCKPINGLLYLARSRKLTVHAIDIRNSGDTAGTKDRVVGYGAFVVEEPSAALDKEPSAASDKEPSTAQQSANDSTGSDAASANRLSQAHRQSLLQMARNAIQHQLATGKEFDVQLDNLPEIFTTSLASFVTINLRGRLRGCIGSLVAHQPLIQDVASNAQSAAFRDPRFAPLKLSEFKDIEIHISVLSQPELLQVDSREDLLQKLKPGIDGLIIEERGHRATYLPSVWEQLPTPEQFISELRAKAGLSRDGWSEHIRVHRYTTEEFS